MQKFYYYYKLDSTTCSVYFVTKEIYNLDEMQKFILYYLFSTKIIKLGKKSFNYVSGVFFLLQHVKKQVFVTYLRRQVMILLRIIVTLAYPS